MYARTPANEHFLIKRAYDDKSQRVGTSKEVEQLFKLVADKQFNDDRLLPLLSPVLANLRHDPQSTAARSRGQQLSTLCAARPDLFLNLDVFNGLVDGLRREYTSSLKIKVNPTFCHLCAHLTSIAFRNISRLPLEIIQVVCDDWANDSVWIEADADVRLFSLRVLSYFFPYFTTDTCIWQFSNEKLLEIKTYVTGSIASFGDVANYRSLKASQRSSMLKFVAIGCKYPEVRRGCYNFLPDWCLNQHFQTETRDLFLNFCFHLKFSPEISSSLYDFESEACLDIVTCKRIKEPTDLLLKGIWFIIDNNKQHFHSLLLSIFVANPTEVLVQHVYSSLMEMLQREIVDFSREFFAIVQQNIGRLEIFNFLIDIIKYSTSAVPLVEHVCLNFDKLNLPLPAGAQVFSRLVASLTNPNFTLIGSMVGVFTNGYLAYRCKQSPIPSEQFELILGVFRSNPFVPLLNSDVLLNIWNNFNLSPGQFVEWTAVLLENTIRCMVQYNFCPQIDSFDSAFIRWLCEVPFHGITLTPSTHPINPSDSATSIVNGIRHILLCVCSIAPEVVGYFVWNTFPEMKAIICQAICEGSSYHSSVPFDNLLCRCRNPDFLLEFVKDSNSTIESFDILARLLETNEHIIHSIPENTVIDLVIHLGRTNTFINIRKQLVQRMELYLDSFTVAVVNWIMNQEAPFARCGGYKLLFELARLDGQFSFKNVLIYLQSNLLTEYQSLCSWNLQHEIERNILYATLQVSNQPIQLRCPTRMEEIQLTLQHFEPPSRSINQQPKNDLLGIPKFELQNIPPYKFETSRDENIPEELAEPDEIVGKEEGNLSSMLESPLSLTTSIPTANFYGQTQSTKPSSAASSFEDLLVYFFTTEPFNLSSYYALLRCSYDEPLKLNEYFHVAMAMMEQKPHRLFKFIDLFATCISKMSSIHHPHVEQLMQLGFSKCNSLTTLEAVLRLAHNYSIVAYQNCLDLLKRIQFTHLVPKMDLSPAQLGPLLECLQSQKPMVIFREGMFNAMRREAIHRTFQSLLDCLQFSSTVFSAAQKCLEELLAHSQAYPEMLQEIANQLVPLLFIDPSNQESDQQARAMLQGIRAKGYDLILRLLAASPDNLLVPIGFVDSLKYVDHDAGFAERVAILCPQFKSDIRIRQLYHSL